MENAKIQLSGISPTLNLRGELLGFPVTRLMGIINLTNDSFFAGSRSVTCEAALEKAARHLEEGADFLDLGAASSRPGAQVSNPEEEWLSLKPVLHEIRSAFPKAWISVDTYHASVAQKAVDAGADLINDVSGGGLDPEMLPWIASSKTPFILMHMRGEPANMQQQTHYEELLPDIIREMAVKVNRLRMGGHANLVVDPGFGFSKELTQNYRLLAGLDSFRIFNAPVLAGVSRKSMVNKVLNIRPDEALNATTALHMLLLQKGVDILRVHDVKEAQEAIRIHTFAKEAMRT